MERISSRWCAIMMEQGLSKLFNLLTLKILSRVKASISESKSMIKEMIMTMTNIMWLMPGCGSLSGISMITSKWKQNLICFSEEEFSIFIQFHSPYPQDSRSHELINENGNYFFSHRISLDLSLRSQILRCPSMKTPKLGKVSRPSRQPTQIKGVKVKYPLRLIGQVTRRDNSWSVKMERLQFSEHLIEKIPQGTRYAYYQTIIMFHLYSS
jgi:hypothetical protein